MTSLTRDDLRVTDAERDQALSLLNQAASGGVLTSEQHAARAHRVLAARTLRDLRAVTDDLAPGGLFPTRYRHRTRFRTLVVALVLAGLIAMVLFVYSLSVSTATTVVVPVHPTLSPQTIPFPPSPSTSVGVFCRNVAAGRRARPPAPSDGIAPTSPSQETGVHVQSPSAQPDVATVQSLAGAAAVTTLVAQSNQSDFVGIPLTCLRRVDSNFTWVPGSDTSAGPGSISIGLHQGYAVLAALSPSRTCWYLLIQTGADALPTGWVKSAPASGERTISRQAPATYFGDADGGTCAAQAAGAQDLWQLGLFAPQLTP
jgi:hypothetical protein